MKIIIIIAALALGGLFLYTQMNRLDIPSGKTEIFIEEKDTGKNAATTAASRTPASIREILITDGVKHSIPLEDIKQGCFGRDCIPSVDEPEFVSADEADRLLPEDTVGIGLEYKGERRFYPFNMLVTREIVNDVVAGDPIAVTYCPLCGTGIVFDRRVEGETAEFGVSGFLWQSNLLMYNRAQNEDDISLWSQVLGEGVLGKYTGVSLAVIPSDIVRYTQWVKDRPDTLVLNTGRIGDPYGGEYYRVARQFGPDFNESESPLSPTAYVFGIEVNGQFKAYPQSELPAGETKDVFAGENISIQKKSDGVVRIFRDEGEGPVKTVSGFWFSWVSAHPDTELYQ